MKAEYLNKEKSSIKVTLDEGENLGHQNGPCEFFPGIDPLNVDYAALMSLINNNEITIDAFIEPVIVKTQYSFNEFINFFTITEIQAIIQATMVPSNWQLKLWYDRAVGAEYIDVTDPLTIQGIEGMVQVGLLTETRKTEILAGHFPA